MQDPHNYKKLKISAVIPAYNEAKSILKVLDSLRGVPSIKEIIVVSDGSTDATVARVRSLVGVKVIELPQNMGKTKAATRGVYEAAYPTILFCDADLVNLNKDQISDLIDKYCEGFDMVIMDKGSQPWIFKNLLKSVPAVSGTRILDKKHFFKVPFLKTDRFQFEVRINDYFLANGLTIAITPAEAIHDTRKYVKYAFKQGLYLDIKGGLEVLASDGPSSIFKNLATFRKIKRLASSPGTMKHS